MDNVTIILLLLYIGYSIYRAVQKNKEKQAPKPEQVPAGKKETKERPVAKKFEEMLKDIFEEQGLESYDDGDKDVREASPEYEEAPAMMEDYQTVESIETLEGLETISEADYFKYDDRTRMELPKHQASVIGSGGGSYESILMMNDRKDRRPDFDFLYEQGALDLRKAVIYDAILNRPYS